MRAEARCHGAGNHRGFPGRSPAFRRWRDDHATEPGQRAVHAAHACRIQPSGGLCCFERVGVLDDRQLRARRQPGGQLSRRRADRLGESATERLDLHRPLRPAARHRLRDRVQGQRPARLGLHECRQRARQGRHQAWPDRVPARQQRPVGLRPLLPLRHQRRCPHGLRVPPVDAGRERAVPDVPRAPRTTSGSRSTRRTAAQSSTSVRSGGPARSSCPTTTCAPWTAASPTAR